MAATFTSLQLTPALARKRCPSPMQTGRQAGWVGVGERELEGEPGTAQGLMFAGDP